MPQVLSDLTLNPGVVSNGGTDLFAFPNVTQPSVLSLQAPVTQPLPPGTDSAANLLNPDLQIGPQLVNFPSGIYDTSPTSLLTHFMQAILGAGGTGQLRKRQMVARLQQAIASTRFYDLDSFYGALFGAQRGPGGTLPLNPNTNLPYNPYGDLASPDALDEAEAADAEFRERIIALAKAITLGGTVPGMQAIAEAISGVPCQVYEVWRLIDNASGPFPGYQTWEQVTTAFPQWSSFGSVTWQSAEGVVTFSGLLGGGAPSEIVLQPKKDYAADITGQAGQGADMLGILSAAEVLRPAASIISVDVNGPGIVTPAQISSAWADSQYWEIVELVTPASPSSPAYAAIVNSYQANNAAELPPGTYVIPSPPMSRTGGSQYSYAADVTSVTAQAVSSASPDTATVTDGLDYQTVVFPGQGQPLPPGQVSPARGSGQIAQYLPVQAVLPPVQAATARTSSPVAVKAAPYSGPRVPVVRAS